METEIGTIGTLGEAKQKILNNVSDLVKTEK